MLTVLDKIKKSKSHFILLTGLTDDLFTEANLTLPNLLLKELQGDYNVINYFNASYLYPKDCEEAPEEQNRFRSNDESCCNINAVISFLSSNDNCLVVNLAGVDDTPKKKFLNALNKILFESEIGKSRLIIIGSDKDCEFVSVKSDFETIKIVAPTIEEITDHIYSILPEYSKDKLDLIIPYLYGLPQRQINNFIPNIQNSIDSPSDFIAYLKDTNPNMLEVPQISLDQVVGFDELKEDIKKMLKKLQHEEIIKKANTKIDKRILFIGPPGTGKSMLCEAIAYELKAEYHYIKLSELLSMWFGETEQKIKDVFDQASESKNYVVLVFDEIDALASERQSGDETMNRIKNQLLMEIARMKKNVVLLSCSNRPAIIDTAFLRNGRFGKKYIINIPNHKAREQHLINGFKDIKTDLNILSIVEKSEGFNGADMTALIDEAKNSALERADYVLDNLIVTDKDFEYAFSIVHSTVDQEDVLKIEEWAKKNNL